MFLKNRDRLKFILFGGKGGCGKTTSACATALHLARHNGERKILIVSCDPAHSVGDSFNCTIGNSITPIKGVENLWALEINADEVGEEFKKEHEAVIKKIAERGTYFDQQDIANFYELTIPGLDEIMGIITIANILRERQYDLVILDTAPTGHTIRLLSLPSEMKKWIHLMDMMQSKHRFLARHFTGRYKKDNADEFLETMSRDISRVRILFSNSQSTEFIPVTIPEPMSIDETERLLSRLKSYRIPNKRIIVNRVSDEWANCPFCEFRKEDQRQYLAQINEKFSDYCLHKMPLFPYEIRGIDRLKEYAQVLFGEKKYGCKSIPAPSILPESQIASRTQISDLLEKNLQVILFGGKGGVGKTSLACTTALRIAEENPDKKLLVFSTNPAHALSDCFATSIGDRVMPVNGLKNLYGFEIDAPKLLKDWKKKHKEDIEEVFDSFLGRRVDIKFDREVITELFTVTPPGLDEILALNKITDFLKEGMFDLYILDSAATGHLIRFLEMPSLIRDWLKTIFKLLIKYRGVVRITKTAEELIDFSRRVRKIQEILADSQNTEFVAVTIPEAMGFAETEDLLAALSRLKIPCHHIIVNMVNPPTHCSFCSVKREEQLKAIQEVTERFPEYRVSQLPLLPHNIKGIDNFNSLSEIMYGKGEG